MKPGAKKFLIVILVVVAVFGAVVYFFRPDWGALWKRLSGGSLISSGTPAPRADLAGSGVKVVAVFDGDTVAVDLNGKTEVVQAIGINAPEPGNTGQPLECYAGESHRRAVDLLYGKTVELKADGDYPAEDGYGRLLRYIVLPGGQMYNQLMIEEGMAYEYANFPQQPYQRRAEFQQTQNDSRNAKRGLWSPQACGGT